MAVADAKRRYIKLALLAVFIGGLVLFFALGGHKVVNFETIKNSRETLLNFTEQHYATMLAGAFVVYTASTAFSIPIATLLSLAVGLMFGRWIGTLVIVVSGTVGATILLVAARYVFTDFFKRRAGPRVKRLDDGFQKNAFLYLAFLRVVPVFPFWLINLAAAFTSVSVWTYMAGTAAGMIPISFIWAQLGESLEHINSLRDALSGMTLISLSALGLLGVTAILAKNYLLGKKRPARST